LCSTAPRPRFDKITQPGKSAWCDASNHSHTPVACPACAPSPPFFPLSPTHPPRPQILLEEAMEVLVATEQREAARQRRIRNDARAAVRKALMGGAARVGLALTRLLQAVGWTSLTTGPGAMERATSPDVAIDREDSEEEDDSSHVADLLRLQELLSAARMTCRGMLDLTAPGLAVDGVQRACSDLQCLCLDLQGACGALSGSDVYRRAVHWASASLCWLVGTVRHNALAWARVRDTLAKPGTRDSVQQAVTNGMCLGGRIEAACHAMYVALGW
jgi:hypothetical protein